MWICLSDVVNDRNCCGGEHYTFVYCRGHLRLWILSLSLDIALYFSVLSTFWISLTIASLHPKHLYNLICLIVKQYIYRQRCLGKTPCRVKQLIFHVSWLASVKFLDVGGGGGE